MKRKRKCRRGLLTLDIVAGLLLMLVTIGLLASVTTRSRVAASRLADQRAATRLAETALLRLAADSNAPVGEGVEVKTLDSPAPAGFRWSVASAAVNRRSVSIVGLTRSPTPTTGGTP